jgi:hypothetical protein
MIVVLLLVGFEALALWLLPDTEINCAGINIVSVVAQKLLPHPWDYLAVVRRHDEHARHAGNLDPPVQPNAVFNEP